MFFPKTRERVENEVRRLREKISDLKIQISTITKGIPMSKIELRDDANKKGSTAAQKNTDSSATTNPASSASSTAKHSAVVTTSPQKSPTAAFVKSQQAHATAILNQANPIATG